MRYLQEILKETTGLNNGAKQKYDRAPAGLKLYMDGVKRAEIGKKSDSEFVDMMDWYSGWESTPLTSSFKLVWDLDDKIHKLKRPVGLRRVTIGYAHEGFDWLFYSFYI